MLKIILIYIALYFVAPCWSQVSYTSFLTEKNATIQSEIGAELIEFYRVNAFDSLKIVSVEMIEFGERNSNQFEVATGLSGFGSYCILSGSVDSGIDNLKIALKYFERKENWSRVSQIFNEIGNAYLLLGEYNNAIEAFSMSLEIGELSSDQTDAFNGEIGLGRAYVATKDTINGISALLSYKRKAIKLKKYESAANASSFLSTIEQDKGNLEKSLIYLEESIRFGKKHQSKLLISHGLTNKAILYINLGKIDSSLILFQQALKLRKELNRPRQVVEGHYNLSSYYIVVKDYDKAIIQAERTIQIAKNNNFITDEYDGYVLLSEIYQELDEDAKNAKVRLKLESLKSTLEDKSTVNEDLISYINEINTLEKKDLLVEKSNSSFSYLWVFIVLIFGLILLKAKKWLPS